MQISECYFSPQVDFYTLIGLCYNFVVSFLFSFSHPTSPSHQAIKCQKSHLSFSFKFFKVLHSHELCFFVVAVVLFFLFLGCIEKIECKYFPSREALGRRMSFSLANDLYSVFNGPVKSIR